MRTTLEIDDELLDAVVRFTNEKNKSRAVSRALEEYLRKKAVEDLEAMAGHIEMVDNLKELEELELKEMAETQW